SLHPGIYKLRVIADRTYEQDIGIKRSAGFSAYLLTLDDGAIKIERDSLEPHPIMVRRAEGVPVPGLIVGKVVEGGVAQPGCTVFLIDPEAYQHDRYIVSAVRTNKEGRFVFRDVNPGDYDLFCQKKATTRRARQNIRVDAGKVTHQVLELLLP